MRRRYTEWDIETNDITTVVSEWGSGDRTAVLLHGVSGNRMTWCDLGPQLAEAGWRVFAPDLRGAGGSRVRSDAQVGRDIQTYVDDLAAWTTAFELSSFVLAGHSFGGRLAVDFAAQYPDTAEKLVLIAPAGPDGLAQTVRDNPELMEGEQRTGFDDLLTVKGPLLDALEQLYNRRPGQAVTRSVVEKWLANLEIDTCSGQARHNDIKATADAQMDIIRKEDQSHLLDKLTMPAVVLRSTDESKTLRFTIPHYAERLPNATLMDDIRCGHDIPNARPETVFAAINGETT